MFSGWICFLSVRDEGPKIPSLSSGCTSTTTADPAPGKIFGYCPFITLDTVPLSLWILSLYTYSFFFDTHHRARFAQCAL